MRIEIFETQYRVDLPEYWVYEWHWRIRARNGELIAWGGRGYASRAKVRRAVARLLKSLRLIKLPVVEAEL